jgi:GTP-binding protein
MPLPRLVLETTAYTLQQIPDLDTPQVALAGRSNVGKSSLINCLSGRKGLAKVSSTPGKTRSVNCYRVEGANLYLVDLPGYGYARISKAERQKWGKLVDAYMRENRALRAVGVLIDSRHPPQRLDLELTGYLRDLDVPIIPVLTKADKCKQAQLSARQKEWVNLLGLSKPPVLFSAKTGQGREQLWRRVLEAAGQLPDEA